MRRKMVFLLAAMLIVSYGVSVMAKEINAREEKASRAEINQQIGKYNEEIRKLSEKRKMFYEKLDKVRLPLEEKIYDVDVQIGELRQKIIQEKKRLYRGE